jgi:hypothetical protein
LFSTGSTPGIPRHTGHVCVLGGAPKAVEHAQKIFVFVFSWAWTSSPITGSNCIRDTLIFIFVMFTSEIAPIKNSYKLACLQEKTSKNLIVFRKIALALC